MRVLLVLCLSLAALGLIDATIYFKEEFDSPKWADRWVQSEFSGKEFGKFEWTAGKYTLVCHFIFFFSNS